MISTSSTASAMTRVPGACSTRRPVLRQSVKVCAQGENHLGSALVAGMAAIALVASPVYAATGIPPTKGGFPVNIGYSDVDKSSLQKTEKTRDVIGDPEAVTGDVRNAAVEQISDVKSQAQGFGQKVKDALPGNPLEDAGGKLGSKVQQGVQGVKNLAGNPMGQADKLSNSAGEQIDDAKSQAQGLGQQVKEALPGNIFSESAFKGNIGNKLDDKVQQGAKDIASPAAGQADRLTSAAGEQAENVKSQVQDAGQKVKEVLPGNIFGNLFKGNIGNKLDDKVQQGAKDIASPAAGQADRLTSAAGEKAENVKSQAQDAGQKVKEAVSGNLFTGTIGGKEPVQEGVDTEELNKVGRTADTIQSAANEGPGFRAKVEENFGDNLFDKVKKAISESAVSGTIGVPNVGGAIKEAADNLNKTTGGESLQQSGAEQWGENMEGASNVRAGVKSFSERAAGPVRELLPKSMVQGVIGASLDRSGEEQGEKVKNLEPNTPRYEESSKNLAATTRGRVENLGNVVMDAPASDSDAEGTKLAPKY